MPQVDHLRTGEILGVRLMRQVMLSADVEAELVVGLLLYAPYFLEQRKHIHPFQIVRRRMSKQGLERPEVCAVYCAAPLQERPWLALSLIAFHRCLRLPTAVAHGADSLASTRAVFR